MRRRNGNAEIADMAFALKSIAHRDRLKILMLLACRKELSVSELQKGVGLTQSMTSQHLLAMKARGVLLSEKRDNRVFYSIRNKNVLKVMACMKKCAGKEGI
ncbi:MAG: metalloregulator ArsR/SmtB family transcription factor [Candidatus Omnitrophota bacterium]